MNRLRSIVIVTGLGLCLAVFLADTASAQRGRGFGFGVSKVQLASLSEVQSELKLTDEQKKLTEELNEKLTQDRRELFQGGGGGGDFAAMREKIEKMNADASEKLAGKLDDAQQKRLTEIYIQVSGTNALADGEVGKALGLSDDQREAMATARDENRQAMFQAFRDFREMSDEERREASEKLRKEGDERMLAVLSDEQREQFGKMKGEEIEIDMSQLRRGGRRGGGGAGGGGGGRPRRPE